MKELAIVLAAIAVWTVIFAVDQSEKRIHAIECAMNIPSVSLFGMPWPCEEKRK